MRSVEMKAGRVFVLTLDTGEHIKTQIESFCVEKKIRYARVSIIGGIAAGSSFVTGPQLEDGRETVPIHPIVYKTDAPCEFVGEGTVFPDEKGVPVMHMHGSVGRNGRAVTGCFREDAVAWLTMEVVLTELIGKGGVRRMDKELKVAPLVLGD